MANELEFDYRSSRTLTADIRNADGEVAYIAGETWEAYGASGHTASDYAVSMTDKSGGTYRGNFPTWIGAGTYTARYWDSEITSDPIGRKVIIWDGSAETSLADLIGEVGNGPGDHEVTLTIRTTDSVAVPGARIWLSTDNDRENMVTEAKVTNDSGLAVFNCDYATQYYIHCHLAGYTFAAASFTPAAGTVAFTKDIASTSTAAGSATHYASAFIVRMLAQVRKWVDEPKYNKKYGDDWIIDRAENIYCLVLAEKNMNKDDPVVVTVPIAVVSDVTRYILPSTLGPVQAVYYDGGYGTKIFYRRRGNYNMGGKGVWVEGNQLRLQTSEVPIGETINVECWPTGLARLHCGSLTLNADGDEATLGATPYLGTLDRQISAYLGSMLRIIYVSGTVVTNNYIQERVITSYDVTERLATVATAFDPIPTTDDGYIFYEIAPQIPIGLDSVVALKIAWEIIAVEGQTKKAAGCLAAYQQNLRHIQLDAFRSQLQDAGLVDADSFMNADYEGNIG